MKDPHIEQWKSLKNRLEKTDIENETQFNQIQFRIECIDRLISSAETKEKQVNHFR
jgi:hypothetical protein